MKFHKLLSLIFPFNEFLYVLQQTEYRSLNYLKIIINRPKKRRWQKQSNLKVTPKIIALYVISLIIYLSALLGIGAEFRPFSDLKNLILFLLFIILLTSLIPLIISLANTILSPLDKLIKTLIIARAKRKIKKLKQIKIIALTGSFGKSTTRYILFHLLKTKFNLVSPPENVNTDIGIARFINQKFPQLKKGGTDFLLLEMGAYRLGEIKKLCHLAPPDIAILTGIGPQHLESFGSLENIVRGKSEIIKYSKIEAKIFLSDGIRQKEFLRRVAGQRQTFFYGFSPVSDMIIKSIIYPNLHSQIKFLVKRRLLSPPLSYINELNLTTNFLGDHLIQDLAGAMAIALHLGVEPEHIQNTLKTLPPLPRRLSAYKAGDITFIDDSYNINPQSARAALRTLQQLSQKKNKRLIVITGGILEQGKRENEENLKWGRLLGQTANLVILAQTKYTQLIQQGIAESCKATQVLLSNSPSETLEIMKSHLRTGDIVLIQNELPDIYH